MDYAIKVLEQTENVLKSMVDGYTGVGIEGQSLKEKLDEVQTAILVLNASQEIVNISKAQALKSI